MSKIIFMLLYSCPIIVYNQTMKIKKRYLQPFISQDLKKKIVFLYGPRQVGKTTLALSFLNKAKENHPAYFNWDFKKDRTRLLNEELPSEKLLIFDEIHKYSRWRNLVKGLYDKNKSSKQFLVTGSGHLKTYNRGGDSLQGRYYSYRLHPLSLMELNKNPTKKDLEDLLNLGGFPEPLFSGSKKTLARWKHERKDQLVREDIRDLEKIKDIDLMDVLMDALPMRVGSPLSIKSLKEDLEVAHQTVDRWISILEALFVCFRILPFGSPTIRAVKKEKKLYLYDWTEIENKGLRFENLVACQLLKYCHFMEDTTGIKMELRFLRDTDKREVDFVVLKNGKPSFAVECKSGDKDVSPHIRYFKQRTQIPKFYQVHTSKKDYEKDKVRVMPFEKFCKQLKMP